MKDRTAAVGERRVRAWFVPDVAMVAACVTLFYCLFLFQGYQKLFRDSDAGWHIRNGERILETGSLPRTDTYSFTRSGQSWFAWEWGADVVTGLVHRAGGLSGVALLYACAIALGVWLWFRLHWAMGGNFLLACAMAPLLLSTCNIHWLARPHVLSWLFFLAAVLYCETRRGPFTWREGVGVALFTALWANVHASFFFAPVIALLYGRRFRLPALIAALAGLANPYGFHLYEHVWRYLTDSELLAHIGEYQTFNFHADGSGQIIAALLLGIAGGALSLTQGRFDRGLLSLVFSVLAIRSARVLPLAALLLLPVANAAVGQALSPVHPLLQYSSRLRAMDSRFRGWVLAPLLIVGCWFLLQTPGIRRATGFSPADFPVAAYSHIPLTARMFAPDEFGGYLIYRSSGRFPVFFDGRSDLYGADFLKQYGRALLVKPGWRTWFDSFHFTHALLPADSALIEALERSGWKRIYRDPTAVLLAENGT